MRITQATVEKVNDYAKAVTGGALGLQGISRPGDGTIHYVDGTGWTVFTGRHATRRAAAYYAAAAAAFAEQRGREVPAWLVALLSELDTPGAPRPVREAAQDGRNQAEHIRPGTSHLTAEDTFGMIIAGAEWRSQWATDAHEKVTRRYGDVHDWTVTVDVNHPDHPGGRVDIGHAAMIDAMRVMVAERAERTTRDKIVDRIAAVLDADANDAATDALVQLDGIDFDLIAQVAAVGRVINP